MSADFESLKAKLGALKSVELPTDDIKAHKTPAEFDRHLEDKAIENLKAWYAEDYEFIALCREVSERIYHSA